MPELPEVETIKKYLETKLIDKKIIDVNIYYDGIIQYPSSIDFKNEITNQIIKKLDRRGKWLVFELNDYFLISHLRMEGKFIFKNKNDDILKHEHVVFKFKDFDLRYNDTRKFGKMLLLNKDELYQRKPFNELGLEPFSKLLTISYLKDKYKNKTMPIKTSLLDQKIIAGIGNIYADEILFKSHINPTRKANSLTEKELKELINNTKLILKKAILLKGSFIKSYAYKEGKTGSFQNEFYVYNNLGKPCKICNTKIQKIMLNNRGTHYCPFCQK